MAFIKEIHHYYHQDDKETVKLLNQILKNQEIIMATNAEIKALAIELQGTATTIVEAIDAEQVQIADAIAKLEAIIAGGGTEAERQEILDILTTSKATFVAAIEDVKATIPDEPIG